MNTRDLEYFIALVKYKNYTYVAKQFGVSQPSVTHAVQRLEKEFDVQLVKQDRVHQATLITRAGMILHSNAQKIDGYRQFAQREIENTKQNRIKFGLPPIIGTLYFPQVAGKLLSSNLLQISDVTESGSDELLKDLQKGVINIALLGAVGPILADNLKVTPLGSRPFKIIVSDQHPLAKETSVSFKQLAEENFITLSGRYVHPMAFKAYADYAGIEPKVIYGTSDYTWAKSMVKENLGIGLMMADAVGEMDGIKALTISDPVPVSFDIMLATRSGYVLSEAETQFLTILRTMKI